MCVNALFMGYCYQIKQEVLLAQNSHDIYTTHCKHTSDVDRDMTIQTLSYFITYTAHPECFRPY